ncbi:hypothetical protein FRUB_00634 [Fimbriiglobus ruber]|uniref:Uncharacterized protein n=1 Tax=Fimbriiglobus ruber TaxID=1908690 RepID=A0A225EF00_9BACT|nr:hypothetical protein FRUB_00634 [Fimbriiglobus ruber]
MYGPPVPTFGITTGSFGGSDVDKTFFSNPPPASSVYFGISSNGNRGAYPRGPYLSSLVVPPPSIQFVPTAPVVAPNGAPGIRIAVRVPQPDADLWVEKTAMKQRGVDRVFDSPPLEEGKTYRYSMIVRWNENGQEHAESRTVIGRAGQTFSVDFTKPDEAAAALGVQE